MTPDRDGVRHQPSELRQRWGLVAAGATLMAISSGVWYTASVFFVALIQEFKSDYASTAGIFSLFTVLYGIWGVLAGSLLDRLGPRRVVVAGGILLPLALASSGLATSIPHLYLTHGVLTPLGLSLMGYVPVSVLIPRSFVARRGLALGFASAGVGVGILVVVPLTQLLIDRAGWRVAYFGLAVIALGVILPIGLRALRGGRIPQQEAPGCGLGVGSVPSHAGRRSGMDTGGGAPQPKVLAGHRRIHLLEQSESARPDTPRRPPRRGRPNQDSGGGNRGAGGSGQYPGENPVGVSRRPVVAGVDLFDGVHVCGGRDHRPAGYRSRSPRSGICIFTLRLWGWGTRCRRP